MLAPQLVTMLSVALAPAIPDTTPLEASRPLSIELCRALIAEVTDAGRCWITRTSGGAAAFVNIESGVGSDDSVWFLDTEHPPRRLPDALGWNGATVLPSGRHAILDDGNGHLVRLDLSATDLREAARVRFAKCMAPVLSPGGRWIVCRTKRASVLRISVAGGKPRRVYRWPGLVALGHHPAVEFISATSMDVGGNVTGDWGTSETVAWRE